MGALVNILLYSIGSLFTGLILTILGIVMMFVLIRLWWRDSTFTMKSFLVGFVLFFFLSFQSILICGALTIKSYAQDANCYIRQCVEFYAPEKHFTQEESQLILNRVIEEWPLVGYYVNMADFQGHTPATIANAFTDELCSFMNGFILRRVGWSLLFVVVGASIVIQTISRQQVVNRRRGVTSRVNERTSRISTRHHR